MKPASLCLMACAVALSACAAQSFQPQFKAPAPPTQPVAANELAAPKPRTERGVMVGVSGQPARLFAWDLQRGLLWERAVNATSAPLIAADAVIVQEQEAVVVRDLQTGAERARIEGEGALVGADGEAERVVLTLASADKAWPGAVYLIDPSGVRWKQRLTSPVGVPALSGEYVSVPWATQRLSILDAAHGGELQRLHFKHAVIGHAVVDGGHLYVGQHGLLPVTPELLAHPEQKHLPYAPFKRSLPGQPMLLRDGYAPVAAPDNALHRLQLTWRMQPAAAGQVGAMNDLLMLRFYRVLMALDANGDQVRWVRSFDHELVSVAVQPGAVVTVDERGTVRTLDLQGNTRASIVTGRAVRVATLRLAAQPAVLGEGVALEAIAPTLNEQLLAAIRLDDSRLGMVRAYAVTQLAHSPDPEVTAQLIGLCSLSMSHEAVRSTACSELRERTTGDSAVLASLRVRASFLEGTEAPPVGPLAQSSAKMQLKQSGPLLVSHLEDPNTPARDLVAVLNALQTLQERSAAASIERFVRVHHAEPEGSELLPAVSAALQALGTLRGRTQRATLVDVAADVLTPKVTRDAASAALAVLDTPPATNSVETPALGAEQDEVQTDPRSYALTADVVQKALAPMRVRIRRCLAGDPSHPHNGRANLVIDAAGSVEGVFVLPASLQGCVEPLLHDVQFPKTRLGRQRVTHVFNKSNNGSTP